MNYAATDPSSRWVGLGRPLHALEIDYNFYNHETRITTLEASFTATVSISSVTQPTATSMQINLSNSAAYTLTLPTATFVDRGAWLPTTAYFVNDTFTANGSLYRVLLGHTSASTFSPTANDGAGHDYYAAMMSNPGNALPTGGGAGMVLQKSSGADYAVSWSYKLPTGGSEGQVLVKQSATNQDAAWTTLPTVSASEIAFTPATGSDLTATNVADALEEAALLGSGGGGGTGSASDVTYTPPTGSSLTATNVADAIDQLEGLTGGKPANDLGSWSGVISVASDNYSLITFVPSGATTLDNSGRLNHAGRRIAVIITTSGTSSYNIVFSSGDFFGAGTLATGTVSGKKYILDFVSDSAGILYETSRVGPL